MPNDKGKPKSKEYKYYKASFVIGKKPDGTPERIYVRGKTKKERDEKLAEAKRLHAKGLAISDISVREWSERWHKVYKANASDVQKAHYSAKLRHDILPAIGNMRIKDVRASHLQSLLNAYRGGKKGTVSKIRVTIQQLFEDAEIEGIIERNPAIRLTLPDLTEETRRPLTVLERIVALEVAKTHKRGPYVLVMLFCGLRRGECIALTKNDIDFTSKRLTVDKSWSFKDGNTGHGKDTKSRAGERQIPIPDLLLPVLATLCESKQQGGEALFTNDKGGRATKQACNCWWRSFARQCHITAGAELYRNAILYETSPFGVEITPHYLRHTYATDLYAAGVDEKARKYFLGHASNDITDVYTKMSDESFSRAAKLINDYYNFKKWGKNGTNKNGNKV